MNIRYATKDDLEQMYQVSLSAHGSGYDQMIPADHKVDFASRFSENEKNRQDFYKRALGRIESPDWHVWVAEVDGIVAGHTYAEVISDKCMYKRGIFISPAFQGKGIGKALFEVSLKIATKGVIRLTVIKSNDRARNMYKSYGFIDTDIPVEPFFGAPQVVMQLTLGRHHHK